MAELAIIKTGGKQYIVTPGQRIKIEKLSQEEGSEVVFEEVLFIQDNDKTEIGTPLVQGAKVKGKVVRHGKGEKLVVFKFKPKKRERKKKGHRQLFTEVEVIKIQTDK